MLGLDGGRDLARTLNSNQNVHQRMKGLDRFSKLPNPYEVMSLEDKGPHGGGVCDLVCPSRAHSMCAGHVSLSEDTVQLQLAKEELLAPTV